MQLSALLSSVLLLAVGVLASGPIGDPVYKRPFDVEAVHNKVRGGAAAMANQENPRNGRVERVYYQNGREIDLNGIDLDVDRRKNTDPEDYSAALIQEEAYEQIDEDEAPQYAEEEVEDEEDDEAELEVLQCEGF